MKGDNAENGQGVPKGQAPKVLKVSTDVGVLVQYYSTTPHSEESYNADYDADGYRIAF